MLYVCYLPSDVQPVCQFCFNFNAFHILCTTQEINMLADFIYEVQNLLPQEIYQLIIICLTTIFLLLVLLSINGVQDNRI